MDGNVKKGKDWLVAWAWGNRVLVFKCHFHHSTNSVSPHTFFCSFRSLTPLWKLVFLNTSYFLVVGSAIWLRFPVRFSVTSVCMVIPGKKQELSWLACILICFQEEEGQDVSAGRAPTGVSGGFGAHHSPLRSSATCCPVSDLMVPGHSVIAAWLLLLWHLCTLLPWTPFCYNFIQPPTLSVSTFLSSLRCVWTIYFPFNPIF